VPVRDLANVEEQEVHDLIHRRALRHLRRLDVSVQLPLRLGHHSLPRTVHRRHHRLSVRLRLILGH
jgi:hypothetical protein